MTNDHRATDPIIPAWLTEMGYELGHDLADYDAFECERCHSVLDNDDSIVRDGEWMCPSCASK